MTVERLGLILGLEDGATLRGVPDLAALAERLGYTDAWSGEAGGSDAFTMLAAAGARTSTIRLGTAIVPVFGRSPAVVAMEAASVHALSGGRLVLGLGTSTRAIATAWRGEEFHRPVTRLREYVEVIRRLFTGERLDYEGRTVRLDGFRLQLPVPDPPPIYVAALGERTLTLAGELADGVVFANMTPAAVRDRLAAVRSAARAAGRADADVASVARIVVMVDEDGPAARAAAARLASFYLSVDVYRHSLAGQGFGPAVQRFHETWRAGDRKAASAAIPDDLLDAFVVRGTAAAVRDRLRDYRRAGLDVPLVVPLTTAQGPAAGERLAAALTALADRPGGEPAAGS